MSKSRRSALHRTGKRLDKHVGQCQRDHARMQTAIINAFLHATAPWFSDEDRTTIRRAMAHELEHPRRK